MTDEFQIFVNLHKSFDNDFFFLKWEQRLSWHKDSRS
jgi:hypothetical protein